MTRKLKLVAVVIGVVAIAFGLLADAIGVGGSPGIGLKQWAIVVFGVALLIGARSDRTTVPRMAERARHWLRDDFGVLHIGRIALFAIVLGAVTGLMETVILAVDRFGFGGLVRVGPHIVWMAPLVNSAILLSVGVLLSLGGLAWRKLATAQVVAFVFLVLASDTLVHRFRIHGRISSETKWVFAVGLAAALTPAVARGLLARGPRLARGVMAAVVLVGLLGAAVGLYPSWSERRATASLPMPMSGKPNVLLLILDTVRAASLSVYGYARPTTPALGSFASSAIVFENAISPSSWTLPSHGTMFTGRDLHELDVAWLTALDDRHTTLAEVLSRAGYATAGFSANVGYVSSEAGLARGFARFEDFVATRDEAIRTSVMLARVLRPFGLEEIVKDDNRGRRSVEHVNGAFTKWLDRRPSGRPFFAFLNYYDAHAPYFAAAPFDTLFGGPFSHLTPAHRNMRPEDVAQWVNAYDRSIAYVDHHLGELFADLRRRGLLDSTVVVVTSDHGELFGEHGYMGHATTLYRPTLEVPFILAGPGLPRGIRVQSRVAMSNLAATVLDLTGVDGGGQIPGVTLRSTWAGSDSDQTAFAELGKGRRIPMHYPNARFDLFSVFDGEFHYIVRGNGRGEELFDLSTDPGESRNLAEVPGFATILARVRERLRVHLPPGERSTLIAPRSR